MGGVMRMGRAHGCVRVASSGISFIQLHFKIMFFFIPENYTHIYNAFRSYSHSYFPFNFSSPHPTISLLTSCPLLKKIFFQCCPSAPGCMAIHWSMGNYQWPHSKENSPCLTNHHYTNSSSDTGRDLLSHFPYMWEFLLSSSSFQTIFYLLGVH